MIRSSKFAAAVVPLLLALAGLALVPAAANAEAATPSDPATVTADALPTWQVNGVVWNQAVVGNTVYVTGNFTKARPPGVAEGGPGEIDAGSLFAYDIRTGNRVAFSHTLNGAGRFIAVSPDGSRIYVGGEFSTVDGQARSRIAAFNTSDGSLVSNFAPVVSSRVSAITVSSTTVYAGGQFTKVGSVNRSRLAAFRTADGALLPWAPTADNTVTAMVLAPDGSRVIVGGSFSTLSGAEASGMGSLDAASGAVMPWAANQQIREGATGDNSAILSLRTDGTDIFGTGFSYNAGNFEGTFSANPSTGVLNWVNDCHGDTYDVAPVGSVVYNVSHAHDCSAIRDFPESNPRSTNQQHGSALTNYPTTTNVGPDSYGWNYNGLPAAKILPWYPDLDAGTITGQSQAGWSIAANSQYVAIGGEFPRVNGVAQQSLTRFAVRSLATNKRGPLLASGAPTPAALATAPGTLKVTWPAAYDQDDPVLSYQVFRSGTTAAVYSTTLASSFWNHPSMGFRDTGLAPGSYRYTVKVTDPSGNVRTMAQSPATSTGTTNSSPYLSDVLADQPTAFWRLGEATGTAVNDYANFNDATATAAVTRGASGAIGGDADKASTFGGSTTSSVASSSTMPTTASFAVEAWFQTTTTSGGKIVGYGNTQTGTSSGYDRHVYMTNDGRIVFGLYPNQVRTVASSKAYNDGAYHHVVAMLDASRGMSLYVDGRKVGSDPGTKTAQDYTGYWRIGGDNLNGWPARPSSDFFAGTIDDVAVYPGVLTKAQIQKHFVDSGRIVSGPAAPTDNFGKAVVADDPLFYWRLGDAAGSSSVADATGNEVTGVVTNGGITFGGASGVGGTSDTSATFDGQIGTLGSSASYNNPLVYSEELWFNTTTRQGGKLIGFGSSQTGTSGHYDRHVYMEESGALTFGTYTNKLNLAQSPGSYNDGAWHHLVATQGGDGMNLYVDGKLVATNPQTAAEGYGGYWRVGGDNAWNNHTYFAGQLDDVAVYDRVLTAGDVSRHFTAGGGQLPNQAPTAAFTSTVTDLTASFDASGSVDPDGSISSYSWAWGDGTAAGSGVSPSHTYVAAGTYTVTLTVTDNRGGTATSSRDVVVTAPNQVPTASFTSTSADLVASFDASASSDPDGSVSSYSWAWGDQTVAGSGVSPSHTYAATGTYTVALTVTDNRGGTATLSKSVSVTAANQVPTASFTSSSADLVASFDASASSDPDGSVSSYSWAWGDQSAAGSGVSPSHTYAATGTYTVALTVTDNRGGTATLSKSVSVTAANQVPTASFTSSSADLVASFDASASSDPDGSVSSYSWAWGDQTAAGSGKTASHTYAAAGTYTVALTVTDNRGATTTAIRSVAVTAPGVTPIAQDAFSRTVSGGWGTSDSGVAWVRSGSATLFSVTNGVGTVSVATAGSGPSMTLDKVAVTSTDLSVSTAIDKLPVGGTMFVQARARQVPAGDYYHADLRVAPSGALTLALLRKVGSADTTLASVALAGSYTPNTRVNVRVQASGSGTTTLRARAWVMGTPEPTTWQVSATDTASSLQVAGTVGLGTYMGSAVTNAPIVTSFDDLGVTPAG